MIELTEKRQENSKVFRVDSKTRQHQYSIGAIHYKDDYSNRSEQWKDIDLTWEGNRITKAPYELTRDGNKLTIRNKRSGEVSTIELLEGATPDVDIEIIPEFSRVRFTRVLKSNKAPLTAKFKVTGNWRVRASDEEGEIPVESSIKDGILTETLILIEKDGKQYKNRPRFVGYEESYNGEQIEKWEDELIEVRYPVRIDPIWSIAAGSDDCVRRFDTSNFSTTGDILRVGYKDVTSTDNGSAFRFLDVDVPSGATITLCQLKVTAQTNRTEATVNTRLRIEKTATPATFSTEGDFDGRTWTTELIRWDGVEAFTADTEYTSPDIKSCVQELADLGAITHLVVLWDDWEKRSTQASNVVRDCDSYDTGGGNVARLELTFTVAVAAKRGWAQK